jgi:tetratricopeptide (TPR) repeat protein
MNNNRELTFFGCGSLSGFILRIALLAATSAVMIADGSLSAYQRTPPRGKSPRPLGRQSPARPKAGSPPKKKRPPERPKSDDSEEPQTDERRNITDLRSAEHLPRLKDLAVPTAERLHQIPVDWIVLKGPDRENPLVVVVKPVFPRPDTLKKLEATYEEFRRKPRALTDEEKEARAKEKYELQNLVINLPDETKGEIYDIPTRMIDRIVYHEDLVIRRAGLLINERRFRDGFELLFPLERQSPDWEGLREQTRHLLLLEAEQEIANGALESALTFLEELHNRDPNYPGLRAHLGEAIDHLVSGSVQTGKFREARHFLVRLARLEPKHEVLIKWQQRLLSDARQLMESAQSASRKGDHATAFKLIDQAARVDPAVPGLTDLHRRLGGRYQRIDVGVLNLPGEGSNLPYATLGDRRETRLTQLNLYEVDHIDDVTHYRSRVFEQWEPTDLGRRAVFHLKSTRARWESRPLLTATPVLSAIESRLNPESSEYDERLAHRISSISPRSPFEFELGFAQAPPRTELLFRFPVTAVPYEDLSTSRPEAPRIISRRFTKDAGTMAEAVYTRAFPQPDGRNEYQVAEVHERRYDSPERALQGLFRGEISMLPDLPIWLIEPLRDDQRYFVLDYAIPTSHVLQFNPRSAPLKSRELRLALAYAIDAPRLLSKAILHGSQAAKGRLVTAPFATTSYAYNSLVPPRPYNLTLAASLFDAAKKRLKKSPHLRIVCSPGIAAQSALAEMVKEWARIGIEVEVIANLPAGISAPAAEWDVAYRTLRMEEPFVELWPLLTLDSRARVEGLRHLPDWLRQELLALDNAADWNTAVTRLQQLHAHLFAEAEYIPLWEVNESLVLRKNIHDFPASRFLSAYQGIERWTVQPWFPEDTP